MTVDATLSTTLPVDGQACFIGTGERKIHCVAWGCVNTKVTPATPLGASPADGMSLQRTPTGAALTVAAPTPHVANSDGAMDEPCPVAPAPDGAPIDEMDGGGGCCQGSGGGATALLALVGLTGLMWRRFV
jgi:hypothetical protein